MIQRQVGAHWENQYSFDMTTVSDQDIAISNFYMSKNPRSHFYRDRFVGKFTETGRMGLFENTFTLREGLEMVRRETVDDGAQWLNLLQDRFGLKLDFNKAERAKLLAHSQ